MFERFTERARQVVVLAQEESRRMRHPVIDVEHLLLGVLREEEGLGARALEKVGVTLDGARTRALAAHRQAPEGSPVGQIPFTVAGKKVLENALREALSLGHNYIGTEHILLALTRVPDVLVPMEQTRDTIMLHLGGPVTGTGGKGLVAPADAIHTFLLEGLGKKKPPAVPPGKAALEDAADPLRSLVPDWVWATFLDQRIDRERGVRLIHDAIHATLQRVHGTPALTPDLRDEITEAVIKHNPDIAG